VIRIWEREGSPTIFLFGFFTNTRVNARASHGVWTCVPLLFCASRHRHRVSSMKEDQQLVQVQSSLDHCANLSPLQANISWRSCGQSPLSACSSGFSTKFRRRFLATNSRSSCPLRSSQSNNIIGDQVLCSTRQNTHSFRCTSWGAVDVRNGF
jgi:hypothetical protein